MSPNALATLEQARRGEITLRCCICRGTLETAGASLHCTNPACRSVFPVVDGIPILINEARSIFSIADFLGRKPTFFRPRARWKQILGGFVPRLGCNLKARQNYSRFAELLLRQNEHPQVLVIGGGIAGEGMDGLLADPRLDILETDVAFGPRTVLICDAHDLPFDNTAFDGVVAQAVLEHVVDPYRCVEEIYRVLKPGGIVYADTPFMQQVHGRQYDFTRFTSLGHRRLFRLFEEISSGASCGPGMSLAWSYEYFLLSAASSKIARMALTLFARLTSFWLRFLDPILIDRPGALDAAAACFFLGKKSGRALTDHELIRSYRGAL